MGEFSAHRITVSAGERVVIATPVNLYVNPIGDDVLNSGIEEDSPFRTPARAIEWLNDKYISEFGFVTINFAAGIYDLSESLVFDHDQGDRVAFVGAEPETLLLQYVSYYKTSGFTAGNTGYYKYYSGVKHGITLACVRPSDSTVYAPIGSSNAISNVCGVSGSGVLIEDYDLVFKDDYNPAYFYAAYPFHPRNNIVRQGSILGCHKLWGVTGGIITLQSSIRDDWFSIPAGTSSSWGRFYGNAQMGVSYFNNTVAVPSDYTDQAENTNNVWMIPNNNVASIDKKGHYLSSVPVGYFGTNATTGITIGATANLMGVSFPNGSTSGKTASFTWQEYNGTNYAGWYTATGPNGSFLNDTILFGSNYHEHTPVSGTGGMGVSGSWRSINSNRITVKLIPTVFRRFGNILKISGNGLRKIQNIFFDGVDMQSHYKLIGNSETGYSNKVAVYAKNTRVGESVSNEPDGLGAGLFGNSGVKDFHVGFYADHGTDAYLGKLIASNCSYGIIANNGSNIVTLGSVCSGMASTGFGAFGSSSMVADRCFASFVGQSHVTLRLKQVSGSTLSDSSFIPGATYASPDGRIKGTVWDWDPRDKTLVVAVRVGMLEGGDAIFQY
jgi:hypothetical protein